MKIKNNKGQVWSFDLMIAGVIFLIGVIILFFYTINFSDQSKGQLSEFFYEGNLGSELLLSEEDFGILSQGVVNQTKLDNFSDLSDQAKKNSLGLNNNFYFRMKNLTIKGVPAEYVGVVNTSNVDNLVQITRLAVYKNKPVKFEMFVWN